VSTDIALYARGGRRTENEWVAAAGVVEAKPDLVGESITAVIIAQAFYVHL
jgi:hypothetical protein